MYPLECNGRIATIQYDRPRWEEPRREPAPYQRNLRNQLGHDRWVAYLRAARKIKKREPEDMAPQGMVPFGNYPAPERRKRQK